LHSAGPLVAYFKYDRFAGILVEIGFLDSRVALSYLPLPVLILHFRYLLHFCPHIHTWAEVYDAIVVNRVDFGKLNSEFLGKDWWFAPRRTVTKLWNCDEHEVKFEQKVLKPFWKASNRIRARAVVISTCFDAVILV